MPWSRLQSFAGTAANLATATATPGSNLTAGSTLIAAVGVSQGSTHGTISSVKDAALNSMIQVASIQFSGTTSMLYLFAMNTPAGDVGAKPVITATCTHVEWLGMLVQEVAGLTVGSTLAALVDGTPGTAQASASTTITPTYSSSVAGEYLISAIGDNAGANTFTKPSALTADPNNQAANGNCDVAIAYGNSTGGTESAVWGLNASGAYETVLCAFKLASAAPVSVARSPVAMMRASYY